MFTKTNCIRKLTIINLIVLNLSLSKDEAHNFNFKILITFKIVDSSAQKFYSFPEIKSFVVSVTADFPEICHYFLKLIFGC